MNNDPRLYICGINGCGKGAATEWGDGIHRCAEHHEELQRALLKELDLKGRRERLEEALYTQIVMHNYREAYPHSLSDSDLKAYAETARRYASHLVDS